MANAILESLRGKVPDLILACCIDEVMRFKLDLPWVEQQDEKSYVVASDGRIAARILRLHCPVDLPALPVGSMVPHIGRDLGKFWNAKYRSPPVALPEAGSEPNPEQCQKCKGTGQFRYGRTKDECWYCDGMGTIEPAAERVEIDPASQYGLGEDYIRKLRAVGVTHVELPLRKMVGGGSVVNVEAPVRFTLGDVEGLLMPRMDGLADS